MYVQIAENQFKTKKPHVEHVVQIIVKVAKNFLATLVCFVASQGNKKM